MVKDQQSYRDVLSRLEAKDKKGKVVDARVDAHTLDAAKKMFLRQFPMHEIVKCTRIQSYIEKKGGINALWFKQLWKDKEEY